MDVDNRPLFTHGQLSPRNYETDIKRTNEKLIATFPVTLVFGSTVVIQYVRRSSIHTITKKPTELVWQVSLSFLLFLFCQYPHLPFLCALAGCAMLCGLRRVEGKWLIKGFLFILRGFCCDVRDLSIYSYAGTPPSQYNRITLSYSSREVSHASAQPYDNVEYTCKMQYPQQQWVEAIEVTMYYLSSFPRRIDSQISTEPRLHKK